MFILLKCLLYFIAIKFDGALFYIGFNSLTIDDFVLCYWLLSLEI